MKKAIELDASGLIYLAKAGLLDLVEDLYEEIIITDAVYQEVVIRGKAGGYPDALVIERAVIEGHIQVKQLSPAANKRLDEANLRQQGISRPSHIEEMRADVAAMLIRSGRSDIAERLAG